MTHNRAMGIMKHAYKQVAGCFPDSDGIRNSLAALTLENGIEQKKEEASKPIIPAHYDKKVTPWDLERCMESSGDAFVDARRTDAIEYAFRMKGDLIGDLKKARHCLDAAILFLESKPE